MVRETRYLIVRNLPENCTEETVIDHFQRYGKIQSVKLQAAKDNDFGSGGGGHTATVAFNDIKSAAKAHHAKNALGDLTLRTDYWEGSSGSVAALANVAGNSSGGGNAGGVCGSNSGPSSVQSSGNSIIRTGGGGSNNYTAASSSSSVSASRPISAFSNWTKTSQDDDNSNQEKGEAGNTSGGAATSSSANPPSSTSVLDKQLSSTSFELQRGRARERFSKKKFGQKGFEKTTGSFGRHGTTTSSRTLEALRSQSEAAVAAAAAAAATLQSSSTTCTATTSLSSSVITGTLSSASTAGLAIALDPKDPSGKDLSTSVTSKDMIRSSSHQQQPRSVAASPSSRHSGGQGKPMSSSMSRSVSRSRSRSRGSRSSSSHSDSTGTSRSTSPHRNYSSSAARPQSMVGASRLVSSEVKEAKKDEEEGERRPLGICVIGLPLRSTDSSLRDGLYHEYKKHGKVTFVQVMGEAEGRCAVVSFRKPEDASKALEASQGKTFFGAKIKVTSHEGVEVDDNDPRLNDNDFMDEYHLKSTRTLFVGNLTKETTIVELVEKFKPYGEIIDVDIKRQGAATAFGFVQYVDIVSVVNALKAMEGEHIGTNKIKLGFGKSMPTYCVWLDNIPSDTTSRSLKSWFQRYGDINNCYVDRDRNKAIIFYSTYEDAQHCVNDIKMRPHIMKKKLQVDFASRECQADFLDKMEESSQLRASQRPDERGMLKFRQQRSFDSFQDDGSPTSYAYNSRTPGNYSSRNGRTPTTNATSSSTSFRRGGIRQYDYNEEGSNYSSSRRSSRRSGTDDYNQPSSYYTKGSGEDYDQVLGDYRHSQRERRERDHSPRHSVDHSRRSSRDHSLDRYDDRSKDRQVDLYNSRDTSPSSDHNSYRSDSRYRTTRDKYSTSRDRYDDKSDDKDIIMSSPVYLNHSSSHDDFHRRRSRSQTPSTPTHEDSYNKMYYMDDIKRSSVNDGDFDSFSSLQKRKDIDDCNKIKYSTKLGAEVAKTAEKSRKRTHEESGLSDSSSKMDVKTVKRADKEKSSGNFTSNKMRMIYEQLKVAEQMKGGGHSLKRSPTSPTSHEDSENGSVSEGDLHHQKQQLLLELSELHDESLGTSDIESPRSAKVRSVAVKEALCNSGRNPMDRRREERSRRVELNHKLNDKRYSMAKNDRLGLTDEMGSSREDKSPLDDKNDNSDYEYDSSSKALSKRRRLELSNRSLLSSLDGSDNDDFEVHPDKIIDHHHRLHHHHRGVCDNVVESSRSVATKLFDDNKDRDGSGKILDNLSCDIRDLSKDRLISDRDLPVIKHHRSSTSSKLHSSHYHPEFGVQDSPLGQFSPDISEGHTQDSITSENSFTEKSGSSIKHRSRSPSPWQCSPPRSPSDKDNNSGSEFDFYHKDYLPDLLPDDIVLSEEETSDPSQVPGEPSLEERIRAIDEIMNMTSASKSDSILLASSLSQKDMTNNNENNTSFYSKFRIRKRDSNLPLGKDGLSENKKPEPSVIVQQVLAKRSILDQDYKRLEQMNEKYDPKVSSHQQKDTKNSALSSISVKVEPNSVLSDKIIIKSESELGLRVSATVLSSSSSCSLSSSLSTLSQPLLSTSSPASLSHPVTMSPSMLQPTVTTVSAGSTETTLTTSNVYTSVVVSSAVCSSSSLAAAASASSISKSEEVLHSKSSLSLASGTTKDSVIAAAFSPKHCPPSSSISSPLLSMSTCLPTPSSSSSSVSCASLSLSSSKSSISHPISSPSSFQPSKLSISLSSSASSLPPPHLSSKHLTSKHPSSLSTPSTIATSSPSPMITSTLQPSLLINELPSGTSAATPFTQGRDTKSQLTPTPGSEAPHLHSPSFTPEKYRSGHTSSPRLPSYEQNEQSDNMPKLTNSKVEERLVSSNNINSERLKKELDNDDNSDDCDVVKKMAFSKDGGVSEPEIESPLSEKSETSSTVSLSTLDTKSQGKVSHLLTPLSVNVESSNATSSLSPSRPSPGTIKCKAEASPIEDSIFKLESKPKEESGKKGNEMKMELGLVKENGPLSLGNNSQVVMSVMSKGNVEKKDFSSIQDSSLVFQKEKDAISSICPLTNLPGNNCSKSISKPNSGSPSTTNTLLSTSSTLSYSTPAAPSSSTSSSSHKLKSDGDRSEKKTASKQSSHHSKMANSNKTEPLFAPDVKIDQNQKADSKHQNSSNFNKDKNSSNSLKTSSSASEKKSPKLSSKENHEKNKESESDKPEKKSEAGSSDKIRHESTLKNKDGEKTKSKEKRDQGKDEAKSKQKEKEEVKIEKKTDKKKEEKKGDKKMHKDVKSSSDNAKKEKLMKSKEKVKDSKDKKLIPNLSCVSKHSDSPIVKNDNKSSTKTDIKDSKSKLETPSKESSSSKSDKDAGGSKTSSATKSEGKSKSDSSKTNKEDNKETSSLSKKSNDTSKSKSDKDSSKSHKHIDKKQKQKDEERARLKEEREKQKEKEEKERKEREREEKEKQKEKERLEMEEKEKREREERERLKKEKEEKERKEKEEKLRKEKEEKERKEREEKMRKDREEKERKEREERERLKKEKEEKERKEKEERMKREKEEKERKEREEKERTKKEKEERERQKEKEREEKEKRQKQKEEKERREKEEKEKQKAKEKERKEREKKEKERKEKERKEKERKEKDKKLKEEKAKKEKEEKLKKEKEEKVKKEKEEKPSKDKEKKDKMKDKEREKNREKEKPPPKKQKRNELAALLDSNDAFQMTFTSMYDRVKTQRHQKSDTPKESTPRSSFDKFKQKRQKKGSKAKSNIYSYGSTSDQSDDNDEDDDDDDDDDDDLSDLSESEPSQKSQPVKETKPKSKQIKKRPHIASSSSSCDDDDDALLRATKPKGKKTTDKFSEIFNSSESENDSFHTSSNKPKGAASMKSKTKQPAPKRRKTREDSLDSSASHDDFVKPSKKSANQIYSLSSLTETSQDDEMDVSDSEETKPQVKVKKKKKKMKASVSEQRDSSVESVSKKASKVDRDSSTESPRKPLPKEKDEVKKTPSSKLEGVSDKGDMAKGGKEEEKKKKKKEQLKEKDNLNKKTAPKVGEEKSSKPVKGDGEEGKRRDSEEKKKKKKKKFDPKEEEELITSLITKVYDKKPDKEGKIKKKPKPIFDSESDDLMASEKSDEHEPKQKSPKESHAKKEETNVEMLKESKVEKEKVKAPKESPVKRDEVKKDSKVPKPFSSTKPISTDHVKKEKDKSREVSEKKTKDGVEKKIKDDVDKKPKDDVEKKLKEEVEKKLKEDVEKRKEDAEKKKEDVEKKKEDVEKKKEDVEKKKEDVEKKKEDMEKKREEVEKKKEPQKKKKLEAKLEEKEGAESVTEEGDYKPPKKKKKKKDESGDHEKSSKSSINEKKMESSDEKKKEERPTSSSGQQEKVVDEFVSFWGHPKPVLIPKRLKDTKKGDDDKSKKDSKEEGDVKMEEDNKKGNDEVKNRDESDSKEKHNSLDIKSESELTPKTEPESQEDMIVPISEAETTVITEVGPPSSECESLVIQEDNSDDQPSTPNETNETGIGLSVEIDDDDGYPSLVIDEVGDMSSSEKKKLNKKEKKLSKKQHEKEVNDRMNEVIDKVARDGPSDDEEKDSPLTIEREDNDKEILLSDVISQLNYSGKMNRSERKSSVVTDIIFPDKDDKKNSKQQNDKVSFRGKDKKEEKTQVKKEEDKKDGVPVKSFDLQDEETKKRDEELLKSLAALCDPNMGSQAVIEEIPPKPTEEELKKKEEEERKRKEEESRLAEEAEKARKEREEQAMREASDEAARAVESLLEFQSGFETEPIGVGEPELPPLYIEPADKEIPSIESTKLDPDSISVLSTSTSLPEKTTISLDDKLPSFQDKSLEDGKDSGDKMDPFTPLPPTPTEINPVPASVFQSSQRNSSGLPKEKTPEPSVIPQMPQSMPCPQIPPIHSPQKQIQSPQMGMPTPISIPTSMQSPQRQMQSPQRQNQSPQRQMQSPQRQMQSPQRQMPSPQRSLQSPQRPMVSPQLPLHSPGASVPPNQRNPFFNKDVNVNVKPQERNFLSPKRDMPFSPPDHHPLEVATSLQQSQQQQQRRASGGYPGAPVIELKEPNIYQQQQQQRRKSQELTPESIFHGPRRNTIAIPPDATATVANLDMKFHPRQNLQTGNIRDGLPCGPTGPGPITPANQSSLPAPVSISLDHHPPTKPPMEKNFQAPMRNLTIPPHQENLLSPRQKSPGSANVPPPQFKDMNGPHELQRPPSNIKGPPGPGPMFPMLKGIFPDTRMPQPVQQNRTNVPEHAYLPNKSPITGEPHFPPKPQQEQHQNIKPPGVKALPNNPPFSPRDPVHLLGKMSPHDAHLFKPGKVPEQQQQQQQQQQIMQTMAKGIQPSIPEPGFQQGKNLVPQPGGVGDNAYPNQTQTPPVDFLLNSPPPRSMAGFFSYPPNSEAIKQSVPPPQPPKMPESHDTPVPSTQNRDLYNSDSRSRFMDMNQQPPVTRPGFPPSFYKEPVPKPYQEPAIQQQQFQQHQMQQIQQQLQQQHQPQQQPQPTQQQQQQQNISSPLEDDKKGALAKKRKRNKKSTKEDREAALAAQQAIEQSVQANVESIHKALNAHHQRAAAEKAGVGSMGDKKAIDAYDFDAQTSQDIENLESHQFTIETETRGTRSSRGGSDRGRGRGGRGRGRRGRGGIMAPQDNHHEPMLPLGHPGILPHQQIQQPPPQQPPFHHQMHTVTTSAMQPHHLSQQPPLQQQAKQIPPGPISFSAPIHPPSVPHSSPLPISSTPPSTHPLQQPPSISISHPSSSSSISITHPSPTTSHHISQQPSSINSHQPPHTTPTPAYQSSQTSLQQPHYSDMGSRLNMPTPSTTADWLPKTQEAVLQPNKPQPFKFDVLSPESKTDLDSSYGESELVINLDDQPPSIEGKENQCSVNSDVDDQSMATSPATPTNNKSQRSTRPRKRTDYKAIASGQPPLPQRTSRSGGSPRGRPVETQSPKSGSSPRNRSSENVGSSPVVKLEKLEVQTRARRSRDMMKKEEIGDELTSGEDWKQQQQQQPKPLIGGDEMKLASKENVYEFVDNEQDLKLEPNILRLTRDKKKRIPDSFASDTTTSKPSGNQQQQPVVDLMPGSPDCPNLSGATDSKKAIDSQMTEPAVPTPTTEESRSSLSNVDAVIDAVSKGILGPGEDSSATTATSIESSATPEPTGATTRSSRRLSEAAKKNAASTMGEEQKSATELSKPETRSSANKKGPTVPPLRIKVDKNDEKLYVIDSSRNGGGNTIVEQQQQQSEKSSLSITVKLSDTGTATIKPSSGAVTVKGQGKEEETDKSGNVKQPPHLGIFSGLPQSDQQEAVKPGSVPQNIRRVSSEQKVGNEEKPDTNNPNVPPVPGLVQNSASATLTKTSSPAVSAPPPTPMKHMWEQKMQQDALAGRGLLSPSNFPLHLQKGAAMTTPLSNQPPSRPPSAHQELGVGVGQRPPSAHQEPPLGKRPPSAHNPVVPSHSGKAGKHVVDMSSELASKMAAVEAQKHHQSHFGFPHLPPAHGGQRPPFLLPPDQAGHHPNIHFPPGFKPDGRVNTKASPIPPPNQPHKLGGVDIRSRTPPVTSGAMLYSGVVSGQPISLSPKSSSPEGQTIERLPNPLRQNEPTQSPSPLSLRMPGAHPQDATGRGLKEEGPGGSHERDMAMIQYLETTRIQHQILSMARTSAAQEVTRSAAEAVRIRNMMSSNDISALSQHEPGQTGGQPLNLSEAESRNMPDPSRGTPKTLPSAPQSPFPMSSYIDRKAAEDRNRLPVGVGSAFMQPSPGGHHEGLPAHMYPPEISIPGLPPSHAPQFGIVGRYPMDPHAVYSPAAQQPPHIMAGREGMLNSPFPQGFPPGGRFPGMEQLGEKKEGGTGTHPDQGPGPASRDMLGALSPSPGSRQLQADLMRQPVSRMPGELSSRDGPVGILQRYPVMWQGALALKNDNSYVQMHFIAGNRRLPNLALPQPMPNGALTPLRISQRMRLEQAQLEGVAKRMQNEDDYCILIAVACGRDQEDINHQTRALNEGFITYLLSKQAAGIVNVPLPGSEQAGFVVHIFPPCEFVDSSVATHGSMQLMEHMREVPHAVIIIATT